MSPSRLERKENITRMRKQQILDAALSVFLEKGFAMATTAEIARLSGVAEGTIYNYFKNKKELFIEVIKNIIITLPLINLINTIPAEDAGDTFKRILHNRFSLFQSGLVSRMPFLMAEIQRDPDLKALWAEQVMIPFLSHMGIMYSNMMAAGKFRRMEPAVAIRAMGGMILGFLMIKMLEGDASPLDRLSADEVADSLSDIMLHGIVKQP